MRLPTKRPLRELVTDILKHIHTVYENQVIYNHKMLEIYEGQLLKHVEESMKPELSATTFERAKRRIPPINVIQQYVKKTNKTYSEPANRSLTVNNKVDKELLSLSEKKLKLDKRFSEVGSYITLNKYCALELAAENGQEILRVLSADKFLVYSDSEQSPETPTVFIKFMGTKQKTRDIAIVDTFGNTTKQANTIVEDVLYFHLYSTTEFLAVDADGQVYDEETTNYGFIPFIYVRENERQLIPSPDSDMLQMATLLPKILADVNHAIQFQSHSIIYGVDIDPSGLDMSPDAFWSFKSIDKGAGETSHRPEIGTIKPSVDSAAVMAQYKDQMSLWLESKGIKVSGTGQIEASASGVAKAFDEADATAVRKEKVTFMAEFESEFWEFYPKYREVLIRAGKLEDKRTFTVKFQVGVEFAEQKPVVNTKEVLEELKLQFDLGLTTKKMALEKLYPNKTEAEIDKILKDLEEEKAANIENNQEAIGAEDLINGDKEEEPNGSEE